MGASTSAVKECYAPAMFPKPPSSYDSSLEGLLYLDYMYRDEAQRIPLLYLYNNAPLTVFYSHGNCCDIGSMLPSMAALAHNLSVNVLLWDYPGYGLAEGAEPTEDTVCRAALEVYRYYCDHLRRPNERLIIFGTSIGSGASCYLASTLLQEDFCGLLLECPLASALGVFNDCSAQTSSCFDAFPNYIHATKVKRPVMMIHGTADTVIPHSQAEKLAVSFGENLYCLWSINGAGHNDLALRAGEDYYSRIGEFFQYCSQL